MRDTVIAEKAEKPSVAVICEEFLTHGTNLANFLGHPNLKKLILPYPMEARPDAEILAIAEEWYPKLLGLLGVRA